MRVRGLGVRFRGYNHEEGEEGQVAGRRNGNASAAARRQSYSKSVSCGMTVGGVRV